MKNPSLLALFSYFFILFCFFPIYVFANSNNGFEPYYERTAFLSASPAALKFGLYGYDNPALLSSLHQRDLAFYWSSDSFFRDSERQGFFAGIPGKARGTGSSFSYVRNNLDNNRYRDYRIAFGAGTDAAAMGIAVNWYSGSDNYLTNFTLGTLFRPSSLWSAGLTGTTTYNGKYFESVGELAIRPLRSSLLTIFGEYMVNQDFSSFSDGRWSAGAVAEPLPGVRFTGRYIHDTGITAGIQFSLGRSGVGYQNHLDRKGNHLYNSYSIRAGAYDRNIRDHFFNRKTQYVDINLDGHIPYQNYRFFDRRTTFLNLLDHIHKAEKEPSVAGLVINTTGMQMDQAKTWEVRSALESFRENGKKVVVYIERGDMMTLHLASSGDYVVMDPQGSLIITGFVGGRTYLSELLDVIGIGVEEFREMEYKSAFEAFSRTNMSDAEREQLKSIIDAFYELIREDVKTGRGLSHDAFDDLIDRGLSLSASDLIKAGLVDTLARYSEVDDILEKIDSGRKKRINPHQMAIYQKPRDDNWGPAHHIAVFYAEGPTMNDSGIRARTLSRAIRKAGEDRKVKAIVLRADSPGGDALASDMVARELKKASEEKPVVVSMGSMAASGGYWISMYADTIVAAPNTITGSIGVISGWFWDDGLSDKLRLHTDFVSRGKSADLSFGPSLPLIGLALPNRPLQPEERDGLIRRMNQLYDDFIEFVADGRTVDTDLVREVAKGRIWTGKDAIDHRLVDETGSLYTAIQIAKSMAGLDAGDKIILTEGPDPLPFSLSLLFSGVFTSDIPSLEKKDPVKNYLELMLEHRGDPLVILPFEYFQWLYQINESWK